VFEALLIFGLLCQRTRRRNAESQLSVTNDRLRTGKSKAVGLSVGISMLTLGKISGSVIYTACLELRPRPTLRMTVNFGSVFTPTTWMPSCTHFRELKKTENPMLLNFA